MTIILLSNLFCKDLNQQILKRVALSVFANEINVCMLRNIYRQSTCYISCEDRCIFTRSNDEIGAFSNDNDF